MEARICSAQFDKTLSVPLGPNALMDKYGNIIDILLVTFSKDMFRFAGAETRHNSPVAYTFVNNPSVLVNRPLCTVPIVLLQCYCNCLLNLL